MNTHQQPHSSASTSATSAITGTDAVERFHALLVLERAAVRAADLESLESLQVEKRAALVDLGATPTDDPRLGALQAFARINVGLIRHLVSLLRGAAGLPEPAVGYGDRGDSVSVPIPAHIRGSL